MLAILHRDSGHADLTRLLRYFPRTVEVAPADAAAGQRAAGHRPGPRTLASVGRSGHLLTVPRPGREAGTRTRVKGVVPWTRSIRPGGQVAVFIDFENLLLGAGKGLPGQSSPVPYAALTRCAATTATPRCGARSVLWKMFPSASPDSTSCRQPQRPPGPGDLLDAGTVQLVTCGFDVSDRVPGRHIS